MDQKTLRELLDYDPDTGVFLWKISRSNRVKVGDVAGRTNNTGYKDISIDSRRYLQHRLAWLYETGAWPVAEIDHINGQKGDNRLANLREATRSENLYNRKKPPRNTSGLKGVCWRADRKKWFAQLRVNGNQINIGCYDTREEAYSAYLTVANQYHREFANF